MLEVSLLSSLEKVMPDEKITAKPLKKISVFSWERFNFQVAFRDSECFKYRFALKHNGTAEINTYDVMCVPIGMATNSYSTDDTNYLTHKSCLMPDWLTPKSEDFVTPNNCFKSVWFEVCGIEKAGTYKFTVDFTRIDSISPYILNKDVNCSVSLEVTVLPARLPEQDLKFTQWFHTDCISAFYGVDTFGEKHWELIESFMQAAHHGGINMIYVPVLTPPLDTAIGGERPTVQLTDIYLNDGKYSFNFDKLHRFIALAKKIGFKYFEIAHLFTQWGAKFTPKIIADVSGEKKRIFGWDVEAADARYEEFLSAFLPALKKQLEDEGVLENTYFHVSDEPLEDHLESYSYARTLAKKYLSSCRLIDAASHYEIYQKVKFEEPIVSTNSIQPYIDNRAENLWAYYCCCETTGRSNRLMAMPSYRTRFLAYQLFKYDIKGFLHWGFNFYYSQCSLRLLNPFVETDAGSAFPSGDPFSVYPGRNGAEPSLRLLVFYDGLQDLCALQMLKGLIGKEKTVELIEKICGEKIVFEHCAESAETLLRLREAINSEIMKNLSM